MEFGRCRGVSLLLGVFAFSCASERASSKRPELVPLPPTPTPEVQHDSDATTDLPGGTSVSNTQPSPVVGGSKVGVTFITVPANAELQIGDDRLPPRGNQPRSKYLAPGRYTVKVTAIGYAPSTDSYVVDSAHKEIRIDLSLNFGYLAIKSEAGRPFVLSIGDREGKKLTSPGPHVLLPGPYHLHFESTSQCYRPSPDSDKNITIIKGTVDKPQSVDVKWVRIPDETVVIQPQYKDGRTPRDATDAIVKMDGSPVATIDGGSAYRVPCGTQSIEISQRGQGVFVQKTEGKEWQRIRALPSWQPLLTEEQMSRIHVDCHEVTVEEYDAFIADTGSKLLPKAEDKDAHNWHSNNRTNRRRHPVNAITFQAAREYCEWRARVLGKATDGRVASIDDRHEVTGYNGEHTSQYPWREDTPPTCERVVMKQLPDRDGCGEAGQKHGHTAEVCSKPDGNSRFGHCDLLGNVEEWVAPGTVFGGGFRDSVEGGRLNLGVQGAAPRNRESASDNVGFRCAWNLTNPEDRCSCNERTIDHAIH